MGKIGEGAALVDRCDTEQLGRAVGKSLNSQARIQEQRSKSVAAIKFCRSLWAREIASSFSLSSLLTVCSSSLIDCSSSLLVSSSSEVDRYSSLID